ncbi:MAG: cupin domain-containing protein [Planctomycetota bacterium]
MNEDWRAAEGRGTTRTAHRPWGDIHMLVRNQACSVDLTEVRSGGRASLHVHAERAELFHILDASAVLEIDGVVHRPELHAEFLIGPGQRHRFWAEQQPWRMLVICFGHWRAEDQVRLADDYDRPATLDGFDTGAAT